MGRNSAGVEANTLVDAFRAMAATLSGRADVADGQERARAARMRRPRSKLRLNDATVARGDRLEETLAMHARSEEEMTLMDTRTSVRPSELSYPEFCSY